MKDILMFLLMPFILLAQAKKDTVRVFYLGGQSNMQGYGYVKELPDSLNKKNKNVFIYQGNPVGDNDKNGGLGKWEVLQPGNGTGFASDGKSNTLSDRFGVELSFAKKLQELYPNQKLAIIKYARNGSSIDSSGTAYFGAWEPDFRGGKGINQYDYFLRTVNSAMAVQDINSDGVEDVLIPSGIIWMQGESDSDKTEQIAIQYYANLKRLMELMRATFRNNDLPIVIGKISDSGDDVDGKVWGFGELVQYGQEKFAATEPNVSIVRTTSTYKYTDKYHYKSDGYIDLGKEFAKAVFLLNNKNTKKTKIESLN
ncbi:sialate O-acetylesterase [Flavobacterium taihuense]|uniref:Sialate O-acetylesterase n=1 Tax=Flavobacterium taihuense TaxID=2857508 RepID=A0ABS6XU34_9FLAO|nr:sialate O-acetylesterase [Flavobacterium taihuense]MBW4360193.1 sialate O-acetylesterase [Flavobacterium taihuense]